MNKKFIITGGTGLVARYIAYRLSRVQEYDIFIVVSESNIDFAKKIYANYSNVHVMSKTIIFDRTPDVDFSNCIVIHTAFTRKNEDDEITRSLDYSHDIFLFCKQKGVKGVIYISSRSVYKEPDKGTLNIETSKISCDSLIATAKYAVELMLECCFNNSDTKHTSLRISSVNELKQDNNMVRPLNVFVDKVMNHENIKVIGGMQVMSYIDPRDVAEAVFLVACSEKDWKKVYNVGTGWKCTMPLINMAQAVVDIGVARGYESVEIEVENRYVNQHAGLDISLLKEDFGYDSRIGIQKMIEDLYKMKEGVLDE